MDLKIKGKTALVTGGVQGIGESITRHLLAEGASVVATSRSQEAIDEFLTTDLPGKANFSARCSELTGEQDVERLVAGLATDGYAIDILLNNAGHTLNVTDPHCSIQDWRRVFAQSREMVTIFVLLYSEIGFSPSSSVTCSSSLTP